MDTPSERPHGVGTLPAVPQWVTEPVPFRGICATDHNPQRSQLGASIEAAYEAKAKKMSEAGLALADLGDYISKKICDWEKEGLTEALGLASDINDTVQRYCKNLTKDGNDNQNGSSVPLQNNSDAPPTSWASAVKAASTATTSVKDTAKNTANANPKTTTPKEAALPRLFARLPPDHKVRAINPYATLKQLRSELPAALGNHIKEVQAVPSGIAIIPRTDWGSACLIQAQAQISKVFDGALVEQESKWTSFVIPNVPCSYVDYTGQRQAISNTLLKEEVERQTGVKAEKVQWTKPATDPTQTVTGTAVLAVLESTADRVPAWISLFGTRRPIVRKSVKPRVLQCQNCWDFHNQRTCTRRPRCRLCGSKDHIEDNHAHSGPKSPECDCPDRCTNCRGPHPANDLGCPLRPYYSDGTFQKKSKSEKDGIRKAQSAAYYSKHSKRSCSQTLRPGGSVSPAGQDMAMTDRTQ